MAGNEGGLYPAVAGNEGGPYPAGAGNEGGLYPAVVYIYMAITFLVKAPNCSCPYDCSWTNETTAHQTADLVIFKGWRSCQNDSEGRVDKMNHQYNSSFPPGQKNLLGARI